MVLESHHLVEQGLARREAKHPRDHGAENNSPDERKQVAHLAFPLATEGAAELERERRIELGVQWAHLGCKPARGEPVLEHFLVEVGAAENIVVAERLRKADRLHGRSRREHRLGCAGHLCNGRTVGTDHNHTLASEVDPEDGSEARRLLVEEGGRVCLVEQRVAEQRHAPRCLGDGTLRLGRTAAAEQPARQPDHGEPHDKGLGEGGGYVA
mmetsp:Transcript_15348/g.38912  ORF Transcript_15348/g.38912 Transcript_15348/m.38912 type:complete len:212 (-) Transcript_15348:221-856(-)